MAGGTLISVATDQDGATPYVVTKALRFPVENRGYDIARGLMPEVEPFEGFGTVEVAAAATVDIWDGPTALIPIPPAGGIQMQVRGESAWDAPGGVGVRSINIRYLDGSGNPQNEIVIMNGFTPVLTVATDILFIQSIFTVTCGTYLFASGTINVENVGGGTVYGVIKFYENRSMSSARMVPVGKTFYMTLFIASGSAKLNDSTRIRVMTASMYGTKMDENLILYPMGDVILQNSTSTVHQDIPHAVPALSLIKAQAKFEGAATANCHYVGFVEDEQ